jgi:UPF0042 nucleotide-binding protein
VKDILHQRLVLVTGPSGAGRSSAIKMLEDLGFESIDNLPLSLIPRLLEGAPMDRPLALGIDTRNREFSVNAMIELVDELTRDPVATPELLYIDCDRATLIRRFSETRRRHPLSPDAQPQLGIDRELDLLEPVRLRADLLIDTSDMNPHQLRAEMTRWFAIEGTSEMSLSIQSFSYKRGIPRGVDMVFDCRFLSNPHWDVKLRPLDGRDKQVADHVIADPRFQLFFEQVKTMITSLLPAYVDEGKTNLTIAFGCTGGKHRSVTIAEKLSKALAEGNWRVSKRHRELERRAALPSLEKTEL